MDNPTTLTVRTKWRKKPTDCRECTGCEEPIYSTNMYVLYVRTNVVTKTESAICESCYEEI